MGLLGIFGKKKDTVKSQNERKAGEYRYSLYVDFLDDAFPFGTNAYEGMELHIDVYDDYCYLRNRFYRARTHGVETQQIAEPDFADKILAFLRQHGLKAVAEAGLDSEFLEKRHLVVKSTSGADSDVTVQVGEALPESFLAMRSELIGMLCEMIAASPSSWEYTITGGELGGKNSYELKVEEGHLYMDSIAQKHRHAKENVLRREMVPELLLFVSRLWNQVGADDYDKLPPKALQVLDAPSATYRMTYGSVLTTRSFTSAAQIPEEGIEMIKNVFDMINSGEYIK